MRAALGIQSLGPPSTTCNAQCLRLFQSIYGHEQSIWHAEILAVIAVAVLACIAFGALVVLLVHDELASTGPELPSHPVRTISAMPRPEGRLS